MKLKREYDRNTNSSIYKMNSMNIFQENEKKFEEYQLTNKTLETALQNKTNEFNHIVNNVQQNLHEVEQKNQVISTHDMLILS